MKRFLMSLKFALIAVIIVAAAIPAIVRAESDTLFNDAGLVYYYKAQYDKALKEFLSALKENPKNYEVHYNLGRTYRKMSNLKDAAASLKKAIEIKPNYPAAKSLLKKIESDLALENKQNVQTFTKNYKIQIPSEIVYNYKDFTEGFYAYYSGDVNGATEKFERDFQNKQLAQQAKLDQAIIYYQLRYFDEAITYFKQAVEMDPKNAAAHYNLALCLEQAGKREDAADAYKKAIELNPELKQADERLINVKDELLTSYLNYANSHFEKSEWRSAISYYEKAKVLAAPDSKEYSIIESNLKVAKLRVDKLEEARKEINLGFLSRNVDFSEADANPSRYNGELITWKGKIYKIEKNGNSSDWIVIYMPTFNSTIDMSESFKNYLFVIRFKRAPHHQLIREDSKVVVVGKISGREVLKNAFKYDTYKEKFVITPLKVTVTNDTFTGEHIFEVRD